jgi:hypothetical protein
VNGSYVYFQLELFLKCFHNKSIKKLHRKMIMSLQNLAMSARLKASAIVNKLNAGASERPHQMASQGGNDLWQLYRMTRGSDSVPREVVDKLAKRF